MASFPESRIVHIASLASPQSRADEGRQVPVIGAALEPSDISAVVRDPKAGDKALAAMHAKFLSDFSAG